MNFFKNLFSQKKIEEKPNIIASFLMKEELRSKIYPVLKTFDDLKSIHTSTSENPLICEQIAEDLVVCFWLDMGERFDLIHRHFMVEVLREDFKYIKDAALENLRNKYEGKLKMATLDVTERFPNASDFYTLVFDDDFNSALMIDDIIWDKKIKEVTGADIIAVSIPARNRLLFANFLVPESFQTMKPMASIYYDEEQYFPLTKNTYLRKDGKWHLFKDTKEQYEEFYGSSKPILAVDVNEIQQLFSKVRNFYMDKFISETQSQSVENFVSEVLMQVTTDENKDYSEVFQMYRFDFATRNQEGKLQVTEFQLKTETTFFIQQKTFQWLQCELTINSFSWSGCKIYTDQKPGDFFEDWAVKWIDIKDEKESNKEEFQKVIHNVLPPTQKNIYWETSIDLGTAETDSLMQLINGFLVQGVKYLRIDS